nr:sigma-70 family RNA polymerase sigma factor [Sphingomonas japonica]
MTDAIARVGQGERDGLRYVYDHTAAKLMGICLRILGDRNAAEDVLQEVYLKVWRGAEAFDASRASPITWLCTIARNTAIDWQRASQRRAEGVAAASDDAAIADTAADPAEAHAQRVLVNDCLEQIETRQAGAIRAAFFEGFTYSELAARAAVPLGTMKSWVRRGLERLRECLSGG